MPVKLQLEAVRRRARRLLLLRWLGRALAVAAAVALGLALLDWGLRLPGWLRLGLGVAVAAAGVWWLGTRLLRARSFRPPLAELALRAEERFPALRGVLASGIELAGVDAVGGAGAGGLARVAAAEAERAGAAAPLGELVEAGPARRALAAGLAAAMLVAGAAALAPEAAATAAARWLNPLGPAEWPRRYRVAVDPLPAVLAAGTPLTLHAAVEGPSATERAWAVVRFEDARSGRRLASEEVLLADAAEPGEPQEPGGEAGAERRVSGRVEVPDAVRAALEADPDAQVRAVVSVTAGDAASEAQERPVRERPRVVSAVARLRPPAYAAGLVPEREQRLDVDAESLGRVSALRGSSVELELGFSRPLPAEVLAAGPGAVWSGLDDAVPTSGGGRGTLTLAFGLDEEATAEFRLRDGPAGAPGTLADAVPRRLELHPKADEDPRARVSEPAADFSVLATAVLPVAAAGSDDLTLSALSLEAAAPGGEPRLLAEAGAVGRELEARGTLEVSSFGVGPGGTLVLHAVARAPGLDGPVEVRSAPRTLRVVDASTLLGEVRRELAAVRREARGLASEQERLRADPPATAEEAPAAAQRQDRLTRAAAAAARRLDAVAERLELNRADEPELDAAVGAAGEQLDAAVASAEAASADLKEAPDPAAAQAAAEAQEAAEAALRAAADLLDAGGDAAALRLDARALADAQRALRAEAAALLPETAGRAPEDLDALLRERVEALERDQAALAERAEALEEALRNASQDPGSTDAERAAAEAAAEAAQAAAEAGLEARMQEAAGAAGENRLADAGGAQDEALAALDRVLGAFEGQAERRRELLRARLAELLDRVKRLREDTAAAEEALAAAADAAAVVGLAEPLSALWERALAVAGDAAAEEATAPAEPPLNAAAAAKLRAIGQLRAATAVPARASEREAIASLDAAIAELERLAEAQREEEAAEEKAKMRALYAALADRQDALAGEVEPLAGGDGDAPDRRARATLRGLAGPQEGLTAEAAALEERAGEGAVFAAVHAEIDAAMTRSAARLRSGDALAAVPADQRSAAASLRAMADALVPPPPGNGFAEGGGGGGGGGGAPLDVPPAAQVKLLRGMQAQLLAESDALRAAEAAADPEAGARLAARQRTILSLGRELAEQLQQNAPPPGAQP